MASLATVGAVKALVYDSVFKRAQEIEACEKLLNVAFEGDSLIKGSAECIGSSPSDVYVLSVSIEGDSSGSSTALGQCSCPAGKNAKSGLCKHVVALLLRRVQEALPKATSGRHASEDEIVPIAFEVDETFATMQEPRQADARSSSSHLPKKFEDEALGATMSRSSNPKRVLPPWMLGVVGSTGAQGEPSNSTKSKKRAAAPKPPRPPPPPTKRARRSGPPTKISNGYDDEGAEDPGEVEDAGPMGEGSRPVVVEDVVVAEFLPRQTEGAVARERRGSRSFKIEGTDYEVHRKRDEGARRGRDRPTSRPTMSVSHAVEDRRHGASRRRRLVKKFVEDSDSENEAVALNDKEDCNDGSDCLDLTDDDLVLLAQEHVAIEETASLVEAHAKLSDEKKIPEKLSQGEKSSIFSMNKWKEMSSGGAGKGRTFNLTTDELDLETLNKYSLGEESHSNSQFERLSLESKDEVNGVGPGLQTSQSQGLKDMPMSLATAADESDAVASVMLDLMFGSTLSRSVAMKNVTLGDSTPRVLQDHDNCAAADAGGLAAPTPAPLASCGDRCVTMSTRTGVDDLSVESKPKKKSSLKDKVKMFLS